MKISINPLVATIVAYRPEEINPISSKEFHTANYKEV
jgi:hypothetical protein